MTRTRIALTVITLGLASVLACGACGAEPAPSTATVAASLDVADEAAALQQVGFETGLEEAPDPAASSSAAAPDRAEKRKERRQAARKFLRKNTLHGEMTVQGKDGVKTVVVQRGAVTATDGKTITVKSADGFTLTWTAADELKVVQDRQKADPSAIKVGAQVGVAGVKSGSATTARLVALG